MRCSIKLFAMGILILAVSSSNCLAQQNDSYRLAAGQAGEISILMSIDQLYGIVGYDNTKLYDAFKEGMFSPEMEINLEGGPAPSLKISIYSMPNIGWCTGPVTVYDPRFKTDDGLGVGSTLKDIRALRKIGFIGNGEGAQILVNVPELNMTFGLDIDLDDMPREFLRDMSRQDLVPDSARVTSVYLYEE